MCVMVVCVEGDVCEGWCMWMVMCVEGDVCGG